MPPSSSSANVNRLIAYAPAGAKIGYDPWLFAEEGLARFTETGLTMQAVQPNPIDLIWTSRPPPPKAPAEPHPLEFAGRSADEKREQVAGLLREAKQDAAVLSDPASIAWLLNIRGRDVPFTPFALGFAIAYADDTFSANVAVGTKRWAEDYGLKVVAFDKVPKGAVALDKIADKYATVIEQLYDR